MIELMPTCRYVAKIPLGTSYAYYSIVIRRKFTESCRVVPVVGIL